MDIKTLIPIIRKQMPALVAQHIVGVQPMTMDLYPKEIIIGYEQEQPDYPHWVEPRNYSRKDYADIDVWLTNNMGPGGWGLGPYTRWCASSRKYWFRKESDRTMFLLKWS